MTLDKLTAYCPRCCEAGYDQETEFKHHSAVPYKSEILDFYKCKNGHVIGQNYLQTRIEQVEAERQDWLKGGQTD